MAAVTCNGFRKKGTVSRNRLNLLTCRVYLISGVFWPPEPRPVIFLRPLDRDTLIVGGQYYPGKNDMLMKPSEPARRGHCQVMPLGTYGYSISRKRNMLFVIVG
jgi:hypothetical protein